MLKRLISINVFIKSLVKVCLLNRNYKQKRKVLITKRHLSN